MKFFAAKFTRLWLFLSFAPSSVKFKFRNELPFITNRSGKVSGKRFLFEKELTYSIPDMRCAKDLQMLQDFQPAYRMCSKCQHSSRWGRCKLCSTRWHLRFLRKTFPGKGSTRNFVVLFWPKEWRAWTKIQKCRDRKVLVDEVVAIGLQGKWLRTIVECHAKGSAKLWLEWISAMLDLNSQKNDKFKFRIWEVDSW